MTPHPADEELLPPFERELRRESAPERFRMLPASDVGERGVICSFLLAPVQVSALCIRRGVKKETFHNSTLGTIYDVLQSLVGAPKPPDNVILTQTLADLGLLEQVGGAANIAELFTYLPTATNVKYYLDLLEEKFVLRSLITVCTEFASRSYEEQDNAEGLLNEAEKAILGVRRVRPVQRGFDGREVATVGGAALQKRWENIGTIGGLSTGFAEIDRKTDGLHAGELIVLAARPSLGKSALGMQIMEAQAIDLRNPVGILSLEMGKAQLCERLIASRAKVNTALWRKGISPAEFDLQWIEFAQDEYRNAPMFFEELSDPTIQEVRGIGRKMVRDHGVKAILIDSLSVLRSASKQGRENRTREVAECINGCKEMAKELELPVIVIAHISRTKDDAQRPSLNDLRESGNIEQDADSVWMLWQPPGGEYDTPKTELYIPKNRNGERFARVSLEFEKEFCRFKTHDPAMMQSELPLKGDF